MPNITVPHRVKTLVALFNQCFADSRYETVLQSGGDEPLYVPRAENRSHNTIVFTKDYFSSALHEISHWCIAGEKRRKLIDYGYWYAPDGRDENQQALFEKVEVKPQALEWVFHEACNCKFRVSADNLAAGLGASKEFKNNIHRQALQYCKQGLTGRAEIFARALAKQNDAGDYLDPRRYERRALD